MLTTQLKPLGFDSWEKETWEDYCSRLALPQDEALRQFYRQVVYDHFDHFNDYYTNFEMDDYRISIRNMTASEAESQIRFFGNREMRMWCWQYDEFERKNQNYLVFRLMLENGTPPFPPILIDSSKLKHDDHVYGKPLHLIEGTHRVSYLIRMLERGLVLPNSVHSFVLLEPNLEVM
jgi:hypothetical protein